MSVWSIDEKELVSKRLTKNIKTDILIIGAGLTGLTTGYLLRKKDICIVDSAKIGHGVTLNTTAKINYFQERIYTKIEKARGREYAIKYLKSQKYAIDKIKEIIEKEKLDCDFKKTPSYVFASTEAEVPLLKNEIEFLKSQKIKVLPRNLPNKITSYASYCVEDTFTFNPIKYLESLFKILLESNISIYENTRIYKIEKDEYGYICKANNRAIRANKVVFAGHYPYFTKPFFLPLKSTIEKAYIIVSKVTDDKSFTCINSNKPTYSCRFYNDGKDTYQISLGESHDIAFSQNDEYHFDRIKEIFGLQNENIVLKYSNTDIITPDYLPYIGEIEKDLYLACGYNTWGMTNSILAASIISDSILTLPNEFSKTFSPNRFTLAHLLKLPYIIFCQTKSFLGAKINKNKSWYKSKINFYKDGKNHYAIYTDEKGIEHTVINKCPHLGCSLIFNEQEKTWDCPCHSSRFNIDGKCIKGPSNYDISVKKNGNM